MTYAPPPVQRLRLVYSKKGDVRYIGHLDEARFWERVLRRADLPLAYTHGYNPQIRIRFAAALPVGVAGENELLDILLAARMGPDEALSAIAKKLPPGFRAKSLTEVALKLPAMQASLRAAIYQVCWQDLPAGLLTQQVETLLQAKKILRPHFKKPNKQYDLRPRIQTITIQSPTPPCLHLTLQAGSQGNARISEVIAALGLEAIPHTILRKQLILDEPHFDNSPGIVL
jgi:radical SAM-linked protein